MLINATRVYRMKRTHDLLPHRRPIGPHIERRYDGMVAVPKSIQRWCSEGFEFRCNNSEPLPVAFVLNCCDRETMSWAVTTGDHSGDVAPDVMLTAEEHRFGSVSSKAAAEIEWLTDNGSGYIAEKTRVFASDIGLMPLMTPVCSSQSNGMAESFLKTIKRDYVAFMPKPDADTTVRNLVVAFEHYTEKHP